MASIDHLTDEQLLPAAQKAVEASLPANPLSGAIWLDRKTTKKAFLNRNKFRFEPTVSTGFGGEPELSFSVYVNGHFAGQLFFAPKLGEWYHLTEPQLTLDGKEEGDPVGLASEFDSAVKNLCKSKWPTLYKEMFT